MAEEFKEEVLKAASVVLSTDHIEYLRTLSNYSKYLRWMIENDEGYNKFKKDRKNESNKKRN